MGVTVRVRTAPFEPITTRRGGASETCIGRIGVTTRGTTDEPGTSNIGPLSNTAGCSAIDSKSCLSFRLSLCSVMWSTPSSNEDTSKKYLSYLRDIETCCSVLLHGVMF